MINSTALWKLSRPRCWLHRFSKWWVSQVDQRIKSHRSRRHVSENHGEKVIFHASRDFVDLELSRNLPSLLICSWPQDCLFLIHQAQKHLDSILSISLGNSQRAAHSRHCTSQLCLTPYLPQVRHHLHCRWKEKERCRDHREARGTATAMCKSSLVYEREPELYCPPFYDGVK